MTLSLVIGQGGLIGGALAAKLVQLGAHLFSPQEHFSWKNPEILGKQFAEVLKNFSDSLSGRDWNIYWAAGIATMNSSEALMRSELQILDAFISKLKNNSVLANSKGRFIFISSAGGVYSGVTSELISEATAPSPTNFYGIYKLQQENLVCELATSGGYKEISTFIFRISTVYGVGQNKDKKQGLLTQITHRSLRGDVINIYVPLDTMRDYIHVEDAVEMIMHLISKKVENPISIKIIASQSSVTIASILGMFRRSLKSPIRISIKKDSAANNYTRIARFRLGFQEAHPTNFCRSLEVGISELLIAERLQLMRS
jgi:UDP-glucose 4-epimerase